LRDEKKQLNNYPINDSDSCSYKDSKKTQQQLTWMVDRSCLVATISHLVADTLRTPPVAAVAVKFSNIKSEYPNNLGYPNLSELHGFPKSCVTENDENGKTLA